MRKKIATATALLALTALGGCDWFKPAPPPQTSENVTNTIEENVVEPPVSVTNGSAQDDTNVAATSDLREAPPAPDAQTQDDADAVGMTAHVRRDEPIGNNSNP